MIPTWTEVFVQIYHNIATFVGERVVGVERLTPSKFVSLQMQTVHSPAHTSAGAEVVM